MKSSGRKTKLTAGIIKSVYTGIKKRKTWNQIAATLCIDPKTLRNWRERGENEKTGLYRKFVDTIERAESELRDEARETLRFESSSAPSKQIFICFIQGELTRRIHIAETQQLPHEKLSALQLNSPDALELLNVIPATAGEAAQLHQHFAEERLHGQWFSESTRLLKFIDNIDNIDEK